MFKKNQKGVSLLEMILFLALVSFVSIGIIYLIAEQINNVKNQLTSTQMTTLLETTRAYVTDNFGDIQDELDATRRTIQAGSDMNDDGTVDEDDVITVASGEISIQDMKDAGYLRNGFREQTSWGTELQIGVAFIGLENVIQVVIYNANSDKIKLNDQQKIATGIRDGMGAMWFGQDAQPNPCPDKTNLDGTTSAAVCISALFNQWEMSNPELVFSGIFNPVVSETGTAPVGVIFLNENDYTKDSLYKNIVDGHVSANTISSDLNFETSDKAGRDEMTEEVNGVDVISKARTIFFNAMKDTDVDGDNFRDFSGQGLTYMQKYDADGNPASKAVLSLNNSLISTGSAGQGEDIPFFSAEGGIVTDREEVANSECSFDPTDIYSDFGVIVKSSTGSLLKCVSDGHWREFGDVEMVIPFNLTLTTATAKDTDTETYDMELESASAVVLMANPAIVAHVAGTTTESSFQIKDPVSSQYRSLVDINVSSLTPTQNIFISNSAIFPIKEGTIIHQETGADFEAGTVISVIGYID